jgi:hypothetical protein
MAPDSAATYWCDGCKRYLPHASELDDGTGAPVPCPICRRPLTVERRAAAFAKPDDVGGAYPVVLGRAFLFPFRGMTLAIIGGTAVVAYIAALIPLFGWLLALAVQAAFLFQIVRTTAVGQDDFTMEAETVLDWVSPLGRYFGTFLVAGAPALAAWIGTQSVPLTVAGGALGLVYLPAGFIAASYPSGCLGPLNPLPAIVLIARIPGAYAITLAFLAVTVGLGVGAGYAAKAISTALAPVPVLPMLLALVLRMLPPAIAARMLGLLVREHGDELIDG